MPPYFQFLLIRENSKLPDYFITTEWINIKNKSNNEHHQVKKEKEFSLSEQSISSNIYKYLSTSIRYDYHSITLLFHVAYAYFSDK